MIRRPPRSTHCISSAASDVYKRQQMHDIHAIQEIQISLQTMEKISSNLDKLFIAAAFLAGVSCLARADYNLPLFIFIYFVWSRDSVLCFCLYRRKSCRLLDCW
eukprot:TRINITY_DN25948_c0_g1_i4.p2 TRINITY_DN25948_c0_g1~~TRINITY_DN25948_c0_g1_i4.p2  ORF type:complete len:104 (+),score=10.25 TRINITY_DN25948_c0_g1_i4:70-381(+)